MSATKVIMVFNAQTINGSAQVERTAGWTETYYSTLAIDNAGLAPLIDSLCSKRAQLLTSNNSIIGQRLQTVDPVGPSRASEKKFPPGQSLDSDLPGMALRWQLDSASTPNRRAIILRGNPDARVARGEYVPAAGFTTAAVAFFAELTANWRFRAIDRTIQPIKIVSITANVMTTVAPHGLIVGDTVNIMSTVDSNTLKKKSYQAKVTVQPNATSVTLFPLGTLLECPPSVKGQMRKVLIHYPAMTIPPEEVVAPRATHRDTGSPFGGFRGRRSTKR